MPIKNLEHTADVMFEITGENLQTIFRDSAKALIRLMANPKTVKPKIKKSVTIKGSTNEELLYELLEEIIFIKDSESMVFNKALIKFNKELKLTLYGDKVKNSQELGNDVKALTKHKFKLRKTPKGYKATLIFDI